MMQGEPLSAGNRTTSTHIPDKAGSALQKREIVLNLQIQEQSFKIGSSIQTIVNMPGSSTMSGIRTLPYQKRTLHLPTNYPMN
jgi:hypothetical protein